MRARSSSGLYAIFTSFGWGYTPFRAIFTFLILICGLIAMIPLVKKEKYYFFIPAFFIIQILLVWFGRLSSGHHFSARYVQVALSAAVWGVRLVLVGCALGPLCAAGV